ncbi:ethylene response factor [Medicago truncatula]|uniref:Ethylene response factor n=1 Tax=Medicago truncatula TaxID=3880 RepID=G7ZVF2_MEDTR|nr:ethylene response factor [Medicago truncatula]
MEESTYQTKPNPIAKPSCKMKFKQLQNNIPKEIRYRGVRKRKNGRYNAEIRDPWKKWVCMVIHL